MAGLADEIRAARRAAGVRAGFAQLSGDPNAITLQNQAEALEQIATPDRVSISTGIEIIEQPNYLRFTALKNRRGPGTPPFSIVFDSFLVQRVTRNKVDTFDVQYTTGSPIVNVFKTGVEMVSVNATLPDSVPFYTIADGQATGYLGESLEAFKALYNRYFRASAAAGANQEIVGSVEFWAKGRMDRGYLVKMAVDRNSSQLDHTEMSFDMFVARSAYRTISKPEVIQ